MGETKQQHKTRACHRGRRKARRSPPPRAAAADVAPPRRRARRHNRGERSVAGAQVDRLRPARHGGGPLAPPLPPPPPPPPLSRPGPSRPR